MIILHYTGMRSAEAALERLCDPASEVSAHYVVEQSGIVHQLVPDDCRAWHAGRSYWGGERDINSASLGIEIVNKGHEFGYEDFPPAQIDAVKALCSHLMREYAIRPDRVLGHSDVAPGRKIDPGERFPWPILAQDGIGLWPVPQDVDYKAAADIAAGKGPAVHDLLMAVGYDPEAAAADLLDAFRRHYVPGQVPQGSGDAGADVETIAMLLALQRNIQAGL